MCGCITISVQHRCTTRKKTGYLDSLHFPKMQRTLCIVGLEFVDFFMGKSSGSITARLLGTKEVLWLHEGFLVVILCSKIFWIPPRKRFTFRFVHLLFYKVVQEIDG